MSLYSIYTQSYPQFLWITLSHFLFIKVYHIKMLEIKLKILKNFTNTCPKLSGVYKIFGKNSKILYIGKAKNLNARLKSYQNLSGHSSRTLSMLSQIKKIDIIITKDEVEALLLESNLIKQHKPKYNILLKDNKTFPYICLDETSEVPRLFKYRGKKLKGRLYYGPFTSVKKIDEAVSAIQKIFLLRSCSDTNFKSRTRPCVLYQIKRCSGPCVGKINNTEYKNLALQVKDFLSGKSKSLHKKLSLQMRTASDDMDYEKAALCRDRIKALAFVQSQNQFTNLDKLSNVDVVCSIANQGVFKAIKVFFIRSGCNFGSKIYFLQNVDTKDIDETLMSFLQEFYQRNTPPIEILMNRNIPKAFLLEQLFLKLYDRKTKISCPVRGKRMDLIKFVEKNLENNLKSKTAFQIKHAICFDLLKKYFKLPKLDQIEVYDNSHTSGFEAGGVMIVCGKNGFIKSDYRKYSIKTTRPIQDDYFIFKKILSRRCKSKMNMPDMIIIDGGKGQLSVAVKTIVKSKVRVPFIISLAKGQKRNSGEEIIYTSKNKDIYLSKSDVMKQYLQVLRDEAHRFSIVSHKSKREKAMFKNIVKD